MSQFFVWLRCGWGQRLKTKSATRLPPQALLACRSVPRPPPRLRELALAHRPLPPRALRQPSPRRPSQGSAPVAPSWPSLVSPIAPHVHRLLEPSMATVPRALTGHRSATAPSCPHWPPLPRAINGRSSCRWRSRVLAAADQKKAGERGIAAMSYVSRRRTRVLAAAKHRILPLSPPWFTRERESEKTGHSLGPSVFVFFACGEGAKRLQPQVVELIRQILPDVVSHRFGGICLESGYP
jgi:hypothetical protein